MKSTKHFDVLVIGGGIVGNTFISRLLGKSGGSSSLRIGLVDTIAAAPTLVSCQQPKPDIRVYALSPASIQVLTDCKAWDHIKPRAHTYLRMYIWDENSHESLEFNASSLSTPMLGNIVEDKLIHAALAESLKEYDSAGTVDYMFNSSVESIELTSADRSYSPRQCQVVIRNKNNERTAVTAGLLAGADGANSSVRRLAGLSQWGWSYGQEAVVATVRTSVQHETAWQKYLSTGPLALLPLWAQHSSIVWSLPTLEAQRMKQLSDTDFLAELNHALQSDPKAPRELSRFPLNLLASAPRRLLPPLVTSIESPRLSFPLQFQQATSYTGPRVVLLGDAAHSIHPQAGQGLNLGIGDADCLAELISRGLAVGQDIGDQGLLQRYSDRRSLSNLMMMGSVDSLNSIFKAESKEVQTLRALGMNALNRAGLFKNQIARFAMGL